MANSIDQIRDTIRTSIFGRRFGFGEGDVMKGANAFQDVVEDLTTAASTVLAWGLSRPPSTDSSKGPVQYTLPVPIPGVRKQLTLTGTSTGSYQFLSTANGAAIITASAGTTVGVVNLIGPGGFVELVGVTTAMWAVVSITPTTANRPTYSTST